jgi:hypothetical protein
MLNLKIYMALNNVRFNACYCENFICNLSIINKCFVDEPLLQKFLGIAAERNLLVAVTCLARRLLGILQNVF